MIRELSASRALLWFSAGLGCTVTGFIAALAPVLWFLVAWVAGVSLYALRLPTVSLTEHGFVIGRGKTFEAVPFDQIESIGSPLLSPGMITLCIRDASGERRRVRFIPEPSLDGLFVPGRLKRKLRALVAAGGSAG